MRKNQQEIILNALIELLKEKPLDQINIKLIAKKAKISRVTFYKYFADLQSIFSFIVFEKLLKHQIDPFSNFYKAMLTIFKLSLEYQVIFKGILKSDQRYQFRKFCMLQGEKFQSRWIKKIDRHNVLPKQSKELMTTMYVSGFVELFFRWIDSDFSIPIKELAETVYLIFYGMIEQAIDNHKTRLPIKKALH